jgi:hypothetical protein
MNAEWKSRICSIVDRINSDRYKGEKLMFTSNKLSIRLAVVSVIAGLVLSMSFFNSTPALAQDGIDVINYSISGEVSNQSVVVYDPAGKSLGRGYFRANVSSDRNGQVTGKAELIMPEFTLVVDFNELDEIIFNEYGNPVGVKLIGRAALSQDGMPISDLDSNCELLFGPKIRNTFLIGITPGNPVLPALDFDAAGILDIRSQ